MSGTVNNIWNSAKKDAYWLYEKGQSYKPATKLLSILNNKYISPITDALPYMGSIKSGLGIATAFGFKRNKMMKMKKAHKKMRR